MPEIILLLAVSVYFILIILFTLGLKKKYPKDKSTLPLVSVIVYARNEEKNIHACLDSLYKQKYPEDKIQILIVDDNSIDTTGVIIDKFISGKLHFCKVIPKEGGHLKGKIKALNTAIKSANGEILLLTDADCEVSENWVSEIVSYFQSNTGMVCGFTTLKVNSAFEAMQSIDLTFLLSAASGTANVGRPVGCISNNIAFTKEAYLKTGGFEKLPFSVTEDYFLILEIGKLKEYKILFPLDESITVIIHACPDVSSVLEQKRRWSGGLKSSAYGYFVMGTLFITNLLMLTPVLFFSSVSLYLAVFKIAIDYFFIYPVHKILGTEKNLRYFILFEIYYIFYTILLPLVLLFNRKIPWKGRTF